MLGKESHNILTNIVFLFTLGIILLSLTPIIFPALILSITSLHESELDPFEAGPLAFP